MPQEKLDSSADFCDPHLAMGVGERLERGVCVVADREDRRAAPAAADRLRDGDGIAAPAGEDADGLALKRVVSNWGAMKESFSRSKRVAVRVMMV
jgi:hypothetical protein